MPNSKKYHASPSQKPAAAPQLKTLCVHLLLAGVVLGGPLAARADEPCTAPCVYSNGEANTLPDGEPINLDPSDTRDYAVTVTGANTSLSGTDASVNFANGKGGFAVTGGGSLSLTGGSVVGAVDANGLPIGGVAIYVNGGSVVLDGVTLSGYDPFRGGDIQLRGNGDSASVSNSHLIAGGGVSGAVGLQSTNESFTMTDSVVDDGNASTVGYVGSSSAINGGTTSAHNTLEIDGSTINQYGGTNIAQNISSNQSAAIIMSGPSTLSMTNDTVNAVGVDGASNGPAGIEMIGGTATLNNVVILADSGDGIMLDGTTFTLNDSTVMAGGMAITNAGQITSGIDFTLNASDSTLDAQGDAIEILGGTDNLNLTNGTTITGEGGVLMNINNLWTVGSGTAVVNLNADGHVVLNGDIDVNAGTYVTGGIQYHYYFINTANITLQNDSTLNGNITYADGGTYGGAAGTIYLVDSTLNGNVSYGSAATGAISLDASTLNGQITYTDSSAENLTVSNGSTINDNTAGDAIDAGNGATVSVTGSTIKAATGYALDIGAGSNVTFTNSTASSANSNGTIAMDGGVIPIVGDTIINTGDGTAIYMSDPTQSLVINDSHLFTNTAAALDIGVGSNVTFTDSTASSANSQGTLIMDGSVIPIEGDTITNTGDGTAIYMTDPTQNLVISNSQLVTNTAEALDIEAGSNISFTGSSASSANSTGTIYMNGAMIPLQGDTVSNTGSGAAVYVNDTQDIVLNASHLVNTGTGAGLYAGGDSSVTLNNSTILAQNGNAIDLAPGNHTVSLDNSSVTGGDITADGDANTVTLQNNSQLNANLISESGVTDLSAANNSVFTGAAQNVDAINLDSTSTWNMTADSSVDTLNMGGGTLQFDSPAGSFSTLNVNTLAGSGEIGMNTNVAQSQGDLLVANSGSGAYNLQIIDHSVDTPSDLSAMLQVVQTPAAGATSATAPTFTLAGGETDVGAYQYKLTQQADGWYLYNSNNRTNTVNATLAAQQATSSIWFDELQPLYARMGDLRMTPNNDGVWVRTFGSKERLAPSNAAGVDTTLYMTEVGVDHRLPMSSGSWYVGATAGSGNVLESFSNGAGSATATPTTLGAYATWASNQGWYADFVLKYDSLSQRYNTTGSGENITASSHVNGVTASAETGMRFTLPSQWFIEPQMEVAALYQGGENYNTSYGTPVSAAGGTATSARMSVMVGHPLSFRMLSSSPAVELEPYANFSVIQQFSANSNETVAGTDFSSATRGTRGQVALGVSMQPVHNWQGFLEVSYGKGEHYEQPWGFDVGLKKIW